MDNDEKTRCLRENPLLNLLIERKFFGDKGPQGHPKFANMRNI